MKEQDIKLAIEQECDEVGIPIASVKHYWYKGEHFSINALNPYDRTTNFLNAIEDICKNYVGNSIRKPKVVRKVDTPIAIKVTLSDMHVGLEPNPKDGGMFEYSYNKEIFYHNIDYVYSRILDHYNSNGTFDLLIIDDLGDGLDGYEGKTTRGGHGLEQNMSSKEAFETFVGAKLSLIERCIDEGVAAKYLIRNVCNDNHCFTDDVEVLTDKGWKYFEDLSSDNLVATYNENLDKVEYQSPISYIYNDVAEPIEIHSYEGRSQSVQVTSEHRMYVKKSSTGAKKETKYEYVLSKDLQYHSYKFKSSFINDKKEYPLSDDFIRFCAWINTDGTVTRNNSYIIYQSKEEGRAKIDSILKRLGWNYSLREKKQSQNVYIKGTKVKSQKKMYEYVFTQKHMTPQSYDILYSFIPSKRIPDWVWSLSKRQFDIYLESFIDGDGTRKKGIDTSAVVYGTKDMLDDLQELCILNNHRTVLSVNNRGDYVLSITFNRDFSDMQSKNKSVQMMTPKYTWCLTMPNSNMIVRHNGKVSVQGNSGSFASISNMAIKMLLDRIYEESVVDFYVLEKFMSHFTYGDHAFILTHGKDSKYMFKGLPYQLNDKTVAFINEYIDHFGIDNKFIHLEKGDLHRIGYDRTKKFDYRNFMSFAPPSAWVQHNFGDGYCGFSIQIVPKYGGEISHTDYYFDLTKKK